MIYYTNHLFNERKHRKNGGGGMGKGMREHWEPF